MLATISVAPPTGRSVQYKLVQTVTYSLLFSILKLLHNYTYYDEFESLLSSGQSQWTGDMGHVDVGQHAVKSPGNRSFPR